MKPVKKILFLFFVAGLVLFSCKPENKWDCFKSVGTEMTEEINLTVFDSIYLDAQMTVYLIPDTENFVRISAGRNLLAKIDVTVENRLLTIRDNNHCRWVRSYKKSKITAFIHFTDLSKIAFLSPSDLYTYPQDTLRLNTLTISVWSKIATINLNMIIDYLTVEYHAGTGECRLSGKADFCRIYSLGNAYIYTHNLASKKGWIYTASTGVTTFWARDNVLITILRSGNVYYRKPKPLTMKVVKKDYATGEVLVLN